MNIVHLDTEFISNNFSPSGLYSIALTSNGESYYAVNLGLDLTMSTLTPESRQWMIDNVWPHLPGGHPDTFDRSHLDVKPYSVIRDEVEDFLRSQCPSGKAKRDITMFVHCGAQDMIRLHTLWDNDWSVMPGCVPHFADDLERLELASGMHDFQIPSQAPDTKHHSLLDAVHQEVLQQFFVENSSRKLL